MRVGSLEEMGIQAIMSLPRRRRVEGRQEGGNPAQQPVFVGAGAGRGWGRTWVPHLRPAACGLDQVAARGSWAGLSCSRGAQWRMELQSQGERGDKGTEGEREREGGGGRRQGKEGGRGVEGRGGREREREGKRGRGLFHSA